jgi:hypothetical protein
MTRQFEYVDEFVAELFDEDGNAEAPRCHYLDYEVFVTEDDEPYAPGGMTCTFAFSRLYKCNCPYYPEYNDHFEEDGARIG